MKPLQQPPALGSDRYVPSKREDDGQQNDLAERLELLEARLREPVGPLDRNPNNHILESPSGSQHSFQFDTLSRHSRSSHNIAATPRASSCDTANNSRSNLSLQSTSFSEQKHSLSGGRGATSSTLEVVNLAAELHIRKVAAQEESLSPGQFPRPSAAEGHSSLSLASNQTLQTSHRASHDSKNNQKRICEDTIVKESPPPPFVQTATHNDGRNDRQQPLTAVERKTKPRVLAVATNNTTNAVSPTKKRKSTPVKRDTSSTSRQRKHSNSTSSAASTTTNNNSNNATDSDGTPKRTRLEFSGSHHKASLPDPNAARTNSTSPLQKNSDSRSNPHMNQSAGPIVGTSGPMKASNHKAPKNNKLIRDFFTSVRTCTNKKNKRTKTSRMPESITNAAAAATTTNFETAVAPHTPPTALDKSNTDLLAADTPSPRSKTAELQRKCLKLEQLCQEKDAQLKAVSNNKTILQTAVQSALKQREAELAKVRQSYSSYSTKVHEVVEELMRQQAQQEALRLREQLAADGTRLGRIVYTRAGMRSMESWEEGTASRQLQDRRDKLLKEFAILQEREKIAKAAIKAFAKQQQQRAAPNQDRGAPLYNSTDPRQEIVVEGIHITSKLDALEATESVRMHLVTVQGKIKQLEVETKKLQEEKVAHIRALKRVASEDSSRFRHRPKLHNRYLLMELLGKGGFSEVWRAFDVEELQEVAVKIHQLDPRWSDDKKENYTKHVSREYEIHRNVRHPRIVSLLSVFEIDSDSFATVLEKCSGNDLETLLKQKTRLTERDARTILLQLLSGMNYLSHPSTDGSRQGIIHYDLKPGNILFDECGDAKITDFGLSKIVDAHDPGQSMELTSQGAGTYWYLPPECFIMDENVPVRISNKVDVWSIGVIYFQMLYGKRPFGHGQSQDRLLTDHTMLNAKEVVFPVEPRVSESGKQFIRDCLQYDQALRPTISQICGKPYVTTPNLFAE